LNRSYGTINKMLKIYGIPVRRRCEKRECLSPNKEEKYLLKLIEEVCPNEYKYVGDGSFWLYGLNPDFVHCNGKKKIIEFFGSIGIATVLIVGKEQSLEERLFFAN